MPAIAAKQEQATSNPLSARQDIRERLLAVLEDLNPLSQEEAEMINKAVMEARERKSIEQTAPNRRERVLALRSKLNPSHRKTPTDFYAAARHPR